MGRAQVVWPAKPYVGRGAAVKGVPAVGEIEHVGGGAEPAPRRARTVAGALGGRRGRRRGDDTGFAGRAVDYVGLSHTATESWDLLSAGMREWAQERAGGRIRDPHTRVETVYWYCRVDPAPPGPRHAARPATYDLVMFGRRGLVVSTGTTEDLIDRPGATQWRHRRYDLPVDPGGIRNDHRRDAAPNWSPDEASAGGGSGASGGSVGADLLPSLVAEMFGNLPLPTQRFLLEPFAVSGKPPVDARVHAANSETRHEYTETFWVHLFNAGWLAFAHARRSVPRRSGRSGPDLWRGSPEAEAIRRAPWAVAAWAAPIRKPGRQVAARG